MPVAFTERIVPPDPPLPPRKKWSRQECELLESSGVWNRERLELIDGELIDTMGKKRPHVNALVVIRNWAIAVFGDLRVQTEASIDVAPDDNPINEPEPDLAVLRRSSLEFDANPKPEDILLVAEVSDTTLSFDLEKKGPLYARAGIPEYWILDVNKRRLIVHREPAGGKYRSVVVYSENESVAPLNSPRSEFLVSAAFQRG